MNRVFRGRRAVRLEQRCEETRDGTSLREELLVNPMRTTVLFVALAVISVGLAWWSKPEAIIKESDASLERIGEDVFPGLSDPNLATSLEIITYDETLARLKPFVVAKDKQTGLWKLPSHDGYPADAADQVRDATTPLIGLKILSIASTDRGDHELFGVISPEDSSLAAGTSGVGMLVRLKDETDKVLAALIIGKQVEGAPQQRYVRIPTEDVVYTVEIDTHAFTTDFRDWIDERLLDVRGFDITKVIGHDYELVQQATNSVRIERHFDVELAYDAANNRWSLGDYRTYRGGAALPAEPAPGEQLNTRFLNDLRMAAQDLEIINVKRKPATLAAAVREGKWDLEDEQSIATLQELGFFVARTPQGSQVFAVGGETIIEIGAGVQYVLQFGQATANLATIEEDMESESSGLSRYLLVTAQLDESRFPPPELEAVPETVEEMLERDRQVAGEDASASDETPEELRERLEVVREQIMKENQRKVDERQERIEAARRQVSELNARFADWFYVIADEDYLPLRITRDKLFVRGDAGTSTAVPAADSSDQAAPGEVSNPAAMGAGGTGGRISDEGEGLIPGHLGFAGEYPRW
ncbi:MAG: hypothetical protein KatS3mg111_1512 [Pirellulaceae bacterium]|nr:MAG: hypothetical protein KatS3mg111_1512 [Pirellulaceae bacterium]